MNWGARITISFIVFAMIIFTMVFISMNQDINLVSDDYYKQEIAYEEQIQRLRNTESLQQSPEITIDRNAQQVIVSFPKELRDQIKDGYILLFRPSDSRLDKRYELALNEEGVQKVSIRGQVKGLWKAKLYWQGYNIEYYQEKILNY